MQKCRILLLWQWSHSLMAMTKRFWHARTALVESFRDVRTRGVAGRCIQILRSLGLLTLKLLKTSTICSRVVEIFIGRSWDSLFPRCWYCLFQDVELRCPLNLLTCAWSSCIWKTRQQRKRCADLTVATHEPKNNGEVSSSTMYHNILAFTIEMREEIWHRKHPNATCK